MPPAKPFRLRALKSKANQDVLSRQTSSITKRKTRQPLSDCMKNCVIQQTTQLDDPLFIESQKTLEDLDFLLAGENIKPYHTSAVLDQGVMALNVLKNDRVIETYRGFAKRVNRTTATGAWALLHSEENIKQFIKEKTRDGQLDHMALLGVEWNLMLLRGNILMTLDEAARNSSVIFMSKVYDGNQVNPSAPWAQEIQTGLLEDPRVYGKHFGRNVQIEHALEDLDLSYYPS